MQCKILSEVDEKLVTVSTELTANYFANKRVISVASNIISFTGTVCYNQCSMNNCEIHQCAGQVHFEGAKLGSDGYNKNVINMRGMTRMKSGVNV